MNQRLFGLTCVLILTVAAGTTGCFGRYSPCPGEEPHPEGLTPHDLVGTYRTTANRSLTLNQDGSFTTTGWPSDLEGATGEPERRTASGTWELTAGDDRLDWPVSFTFDEISDMDAGGGYGAGINVGGSRENPHLFEFIGDPDGCDLDTFKREPRAY
ncbi:hypothetical protein [Streptomyces sp. ISL-100]|uniref:hypothetical protein n=1 Tax=Streptomyces sp. ISL-100 TaxID=2819173 RepID=UPI001BECFC1E|nr:hypothetical protein [Streptomyces sp. ISL-100]MBT2399487.1 hypothetical protein [Streptomyces sp. ISL-100]